MQKCKKDFRDALAPFGAIYAGAVSLVHALSDDELDDFIAACGQVTTTNCWWASFRAAEELLPEAKLLKSMRARALEGDSHAG